MDDSLTPAEALRVMVEVPGHPLIATPRAVGLLGDRWTDGAPVEIGILLARAGAFDDRWVSVTFWEHGDERLQAVSRFWPDDGREFRTEISTAAEHPSCAAILADAIIKSATDGTPGCHAVDDLPRLGPDTTDQAIYFSEGPYQIVCIQAAVVTSMEAGLAGRPSG